MACGHGHVELGLLLLSLFKQGVGGTKAKCFNISVFFWVVDNHWLYTWCVWALGVVVGWEGLGVHMYCRREGLCAWY